MDRTSSFVAGILVGVWLMTFVILAFMEGPADAALYICQQDGYTSGTWRDGKVVCWTEVERQGRPR